MGHKKDINEIIQEKFETKFNKYSNILPKAYFKCMKDACKSILTVGTPIVRQISKFIPGTTTNKKKEARIAYHLKKKDNFDILSEAHMILESKNLSSESLIIIDESDIIKPNANKMQNLSMIRDGSKGGTEKGFYSFNATIVDTNGHGFTNVKPFYSYVYSNNYEDESKNDRLSNFINETTVFSNNKGIYVFDRGYDDRKLIDQLVDQENAFVIRSTGSRDLYINGEKKKFKDVTKGVKLRHSYHCPVKDKTFKYGVVKVGINIDPHPRKSPNLVEVNLIVARYNNGGYFYFFANYKESGIPNNYIGQKTLEIYSKRWYIEQVFRQTKQQFRLESIQLLDYQRLKTMNLWINILLGLIYECKDIIIQNPGKYGNFLYDKKNDNVVLLGFGYYRITEFIRQVFLDIKRRCRKKKLSNYVDKRQITLESYIEEFFGVC